MKLQTKLTQVKSQNKDSKKINLQNLQFSPTNNNIMLVPLTKYFIIWLKNVIIFYFNANCLKHIIFLNKSNIYLKYHIIINIFYLISY